MTLKAQIESDIASVYMNTDEFAESVTYIQAGQTPVPVTAIVHDRQSEVLDEEGFATNSERVEFIIAIEALGTLRPREGDQITRTLGPETHTHELLPPEPDLPAVAIDDSGLLWLLQTKLVKRQ